MEFGYFSMPSHPPERGLKEGLDWDLQTIRWLDELGYSEAWIGEHHTAPWEPNPAPDLLIAQALLQTSRIRIGPGGFLLPYHHPAELAHRRAPAIHRDQDKDVLDRTASPRDPHARYFPDHARWRDGRQAATEFRRHSAKDRHA